MEQARQQTHVFISHAWGNDENGRDNHARVSKVNYWLKANGVITWLDSERMAGNIIEKMTDGIDNCCVFIVFATRKYIDKVGGKNGENDNCKLEFNYAALRKTTMNMHVVVHEEGCRNPQTWNGSMVSLTLGYMQLLLFFFKTRIQSRIILPSPLSTGSVGW